MTSPHADQTVLDWTSRALNEAVMGFLALVALGTAIGPLVFEVSPGIDRLLSSLEILILVLFIADFIVQFAIARDRSAWLRSPWRIVDAVCIVGPLLSFLPQVSDTMRGAMVFRFLRVGRAVAFGARAGAVAVQRRGDSATAGHRGTLAVTVVKAGAESSPEPASWAELLGSRALGKPSWYHAANVDRVRFSELASAAGVPESDWVHFYESEGGTHAKTYPGATTMFLWLADIPATGFPELSKYRLLVHLSDAGLLTASPLHVDLGGALSPPAAPELAAFTLPVRATYRVLALLKEQYTVVAQRQEEEIRHLEEAYVDARGARFLREAFRLQRGITAASADLWRLKGIVQKLADGKLPLHGADAQNEPFLDDLLSEIEDVDQDFSKLKEDLRSLMELHMNITSFEMNKFMKPLAIVGFLGLIPSVAGGLLGMNVAGNPWPVTLGQVAFGIAMGMAISLYVFAIKGWLR